jgi:outer membrane protein assembly factor BamB
LFTHSLTFFRSPPSPPPSSPFLLSRDGLVYAVNDAGDLVWSHLTERDQSIWSSPALSSDSDVLYIGALDSLLAISTNDGTKAWGFGTGGSVFSSPTVDPGTGNIFFGSNDSIFYAVSPEGRLVWSYETEGLIYSSAVISNDRVFFAGFDGNIYALNLQTGDLIWRYQTPAQTPIPSSASLSNDGQVLYAAGIDGILHALSTADGEPLWEATVNAVDGSSPAVAASGSIIIGSMDSNVYSISPSGETEWVFDAGSAVQAAPAIDSEGTIYFSSYGTVLPSTGGTAYALHPDGTLKWSYDLEGRSFSSFAIGASGAYLGCNDGKLYAF